MVTPTIIMKCFLAHHMLHLKSLLYWALEPFGVFPSFTSAMVPGEGELGCGRHPLSRQWLWWRCLTPSALAGFGVGLNCSYRHFPMLGQEHQLCQQGCREGNLCLEPRKEGWGALGGRNIFFQHSRLPRRRICLEIFTKTPVQHHC